MSTTYLLRNHRAEISNDWKRFNLGLRINSGYTEHKPHLLIEFFGLMVFLYLPLWVLQPHRRKVKAESWDASTVARMGRDWYFDETRREFGFSLDGTHLRVFYGVQPDSWPGDKTRVWNFPWREWRYMGMRWYDLDGKFCEAMSAKDERECAAKTGRFFTEVRDEIVARVPKVLFEVDDFDGTRVRATTMIEEREWRRGGRYFEWLGVLLGPKVHRSLSIDFDKEVGYEKGSWKGGFMGGSIELQPGELHEQAMRRFCAQGIRNKNGISPLKFVGRA